MVFGAPGNPSHEKNYFRSNSFGLLNETKSCQQWLQVLLPTAPVGRSTAPSARGLWLPLAQKPLGAQICGPGAGHQRCQSSGSVRSAWAGTLPHLLISVLARPQGSEQHLCHGPHVPCLCPSRRFRIATSRDMSQGGQGSFYARPCALPAAAASASAALGVPSAALSLQSRAASADGLSCC